MRNLVLVPLERSTTSYCFRLARCSFSFFAAQSSNALILLPPHRFERRFSAFPFSPHKNNFAYHPDATDLQTPNLRCLSDVVM